MAVLVKLAEWRKQNDYVRANLFSQSYLFTSEWAALRGVFLDAGNKLSAQEVMFEYFTVLIRAADVQHNGEVPKVRRCDLNVSLFQDHCSALLKAKAWVELFRESHGIVWCLVASAERVVTRL